MQSLEQLLSQPIQHQTFPAHFAPNERHKPLAAIDEWLSGWGDRLECSQCWEHFKLYSPFYKFRMTCEPEPFFYGGHLLSEVFAERYKQFPTSR